MVPFRHNVGAVGLRRCGQKRRKSRRSLIFYRWRVRHFQRADWKYRFQGKFRTDAHRLADRRRCRVLKGLLVLNQAKPLSFREKEDAGTSPLSLGVSELAMAKNCEEPQIEEILSLALAKSKLRFPEASEFQALRAGYNPPVSSSDFSPRARARCRLKDHRYGSFRPPRNHRPGSHHHAPPRNKRLDFGQLQSYPRLQRDRNRSRDIRCA